MLRRQRLLLPLIAAIAACCSPEESPVPPQLFEQPTSAGLKIAFFGDQGLGDKPRAVLRLVKSEGAEAVVHQGDLDYTGDPLAWETQINDVLGEKFPYFACAGNHDVRKWNGEDGYKKRMEDRLRRQGLSWDGDLGVKSSLTFKGLFLILVAPGTIGEGHAEYIRERLAADASIWRICSWHKLMKLMNVGGKSDETGWEVYEEARRGGAIVATGHEHSYSRTHLLSSFKEQTVAGESDVLTITKGRSFAFVNGLGGKSVRTQKQTGAWWARVFTSRQDAAPGALFGIFGADGVPNRTVFYFKDIRGRVVDRFEVVSEVQEKK